MSKEACIIKGNKNGLSISIPGEMEFNEVLTQLKVRLASAEQFFEGAAVHVTADNRELEPEEKHQLERTVREFGMVIQEPPVRVDGIEEHQREKHLEEEEEDTLLLRRTIRSGQKIKYDGNIVILGDVNPGAEVVCSGDILVLGSLRGVAHAGCNGNVSASVFAFRLEPTQLRIANYISRSPDEKLPKPLGPEMARVSENIIQISAYS
ncbi:MAG: septum site-determining protein MinC [Firmicutes bacterium]|nr:septum site-determining protein MinC [Bacillota bacterium]